MSHGSPEPCPEDPIMSQIRIATFAAALGTLVAFGTPASAAVIVETPEPVLLAVAPAGEEDRIELVSTSTEVGQMTTTSAAAVPAPAALALFGVGLLGLAAARRLRPCATPTRPPAEDPRGRPGQ
jgi:hypothetical protein